MKLIKNYILEGRLVEFIYIYFAISTILCINITLYSITAYRIFKVQKEMAAMRDTDTQRHNIEADKDRWDLKNNNWLHRVIIHLILDFICTSDCSSLWELLGSWSRFRGHLKIPTSSTLRMY